MNNTLQEEKCNTFLHPCVQHHIHILDDKEISDTDKKLNSLRIIYEKLFEFFHICNNEEKEKFCIFFSQHLSYPLNKWINEEFDECRICALNIYDLIEKNLNDILLDNVLFKNAKNGKSVKKDDNFLFMCTSRLKEDENKKIIEEKEEIRLKIAQFLRKIVNRYINKDGKAHSDILNIFPYLEDILTALTFLIKDPFPLIKKITCELLSELNIVEGPKEFNHIYRSLLTNLLSSFTVRQNDVRELAIKCVKRLMCFKCNRDLFDDVSECLKKLCRKKSSGVLIEIANCIEIWNLSIIDLNNREKAKLVFIILFCMSSNMPALLNERCYNVLVTIGSSLEGMNSVHIDTHSRKDEYLYNAKCDPDGEVNYCEMNRNIDVLPQKEESYEELIKKEYCKDEYLAPGEKNMHRTIEDNFFQNMNKLFYAPIHFSTFPPDLHNLFGKIKKELFYEIMNNEKNSWSERKDEFASIISMFLLYTHYNISHFVKNIILFVYKSLVSFKYIDFPTTPWLIDHMLKELFENLKNTLEKYCYEHESFSYLGKFIYVIIICGYLMPVHTCLFEIAQILLCCSNTQNVLETFFKFNRLPLNANSNYDQCETHKSKEGNQKLNHDVVKKREYIFLNKYYDKYQQKARERRNDNKKSEIILEEADSGSSYISSSASLHVEVHHSPEYGGDGTHIGETKIREDVEAKGQQNDKKTQKVCWSGQTYEVGDADNAEDASEVHPCESDENCNVGVVCDNKKIVLMMLSQFLAGYYVKNHAKEEKLDHDNINLILFLISENINYENMDSFPYILVTLKHLLHIIEEDCKNYSKIIFHFLIILQSDNRLCPYSEINKLIEKIEYHSEIKKIHLYNYEYTHFIKNVGNFLDLNNFNSFKYDIEFLNILLCNTSEDIILENSDYLLQFFYVIINHNLNPLIKSEFLLFLNVFCSRNLFPTFFFKNSQHILKNILLPLCTWKSGLNEAQTRKGALYCIKTLFVKKLHDVNIFQNNILLENIVRVLKSSIDDTWYSENREISISIYGEIAKNVYNNNILLDLLNNLIQLLDDSNKAIRKSAATAIYALFQNKSLVLPDHTSERIFPILLLHMDDDYASFSKIIFHILALAKNFNRTIFLKHAECSTESTLHAREYKEELMK
ncbi:conserved Plasmodium protein, unknown function [Plasmodium ovale curtisi]|uniref:Dynein axonemal assembly factor 5 TPR repeats domain-containing protein n=1 Tax=Plasmodium ovale curtisi TaxID=864141 RepID=A0A1A8WCH1_PLAOA|nr:conserved Plasmodium protein, unknown function [Plasmodium ovale curtisi]